MRYIKERLLGYLRTIIALAFLLGAYVLAAYLDEQSLRAALNAGGI